MAAKETRRLREMEELIDLQDKAIQALQRAAEALSLALQALQQSVKEKGMQNQFQFTPNQFQFTPQYVPNAGNVGMTPPNPTYSGPWVAGLVTKNGIQ